MSMRPPLYLWLFAALLTACSADPSAVSPDAASGGAKINQRYLSPDLDVERFSKVFESESREVFRQREQIAAALDLEPGMAVADIGAGTGAFMEAFARRVGDEGRVYAVEISPRFVEHLRERARVEGLGQVEVVQATARSSGLAPASVDVAFLCDAYHHFEHPRETLASLLSAVRPGGSLVLVDFEREPGESPDWILEHVRGGKELFIEEIDASGFAFDKQLDVEGLNDNYVLRFRRP